MAFYAETGLACVVSAPPGLDELERELGERGFTREAGWMKFERGAEPPPELATDLRVEETRDAEPGRRIQKALERGLRRLTVETGARLGDRSAESYRNILRAGFREAYVRPNWTASR